MRVLFEIIVSLLFYSSDCIVWEGARRHILAFAFEGFFSIAFFPDTVLFVYCTLGNFHVENISWEKFLCSKFFIVTESFIVLSMYFLSSRKCFVFNFYSHHGLRKYFNNKNFTVYSIQINSAECSQWHRVLWWLSVSELYTCT